MLLVAYGLSAQVSRDTLRYDKCKIDSLILSGNLLKLKGSNSVNLAVFDTDAQQLFYNDGIITLQRGGNIDISSIDTDTDTDEQTLSIVGDSLIISGGNSVSIDSFFPDSLVQTLTILNDSIFITGGNGVPIDLVDVQTLSIIDSLLYISNGNSVNLGSIIAGAAQSLSVSSDSIYISNTNGIKTPRRNLELRNDSILISYGNGVSLDPYLDNQQLTILGNELFLEDGGSALLPIQDNFWTASGDKLYNNTGVTVGIGTSNPNRKLHVQGNVRASIYEFNDNQNVIIGNGLSHTGIGNTIVGSFAASTFNTGNNNTILGNFAAPSFSSGDLNIIIGESQLENGSENISIGTGAGPPAFSGTQNGKIYIGNGNLIYGDVFADYLKVNGKLGLLNHIEDSNQSIGSTGQYLSRDADGVIWSTVPANNDNSSTNEIQNLSPSASGTNRTIAIDKGGTNATFSIADNDNVIGNEYQDLSLTGNDLSMTNSSIVVPLAGYLDNTNLTREQVQDHIEPMLSGNTESGINVTYDDDDNEIDFIVNFPANNDNSSSNEIQNLSPSASGTNRTIAIDKGGTNATFSIADNDNSSSNEIQNLSPSASGTNRTIAIDKGGTNATFSIADNDNVIGNEFQDLTFSNNNLSLTNSSTNISLAGYLDNTNLTREQVQDHIEPMLSGNTESGINVTYDDLNNEIDFVVNFPANNDNSSSNEIQNLSPSSSGTNRTISIDKGGTNATFSVADNDNLIGNEFQDLTFSNNNLSLTNSLTNISLAGYLDNTNLTREQVQDHIEPMLSGNTESGINVTYDDLNNEIDFVVNFPANNDNSSSNEIQNLSPSSSGTNRTISIDKGGTNATFSVADNDNSIINELQNLAFSSSNNILSISSKNDVDLSSLAGGRSDESIEDLVGDMVVSNTESGINVSYNDTNGKLNFYANDVSGTNEIQQLTKSGRNIILSGGGQVLDDVLSSENVQDIIGGMVSNNVESNINVTYNDQNNRLDFFASGGSAPSLLFDSATYTKGGGSTSVGGSYSRLNFGGLGSSTGSTLSQTNSSEINMSEDDYYKITLDLEFVGSGSNENTVYIRLFYVSSAGNSVVEEWSHYVHNPTGPASDKSHFSSTLTKYLRAGSKLFLEVRKDNSGSDVSVVADSTFTVNRYKLN